MLILNDVHIGHNRSGGTTPASREALRNYLFGEFEKILTATNEDHVCILGDLFDDFNVEERDWVECYTILHGWLSFSERRELTLVAGNHDWSAKGLKVSSFEVLCRVLVSGFDRVRAIGIDQWSLATVGELAPRDSNILMLAHCSNQDIFNAKLVEVLAQVQMGDRVLLHANYDNNFAAVSDHSLNVTEAQAREFSSKGATLYFAHEHQAREALGGSVVVFGNQWPTSISDCLNNDAKYAHVMSGGVEKIKTWSRSGSPERVGYSEIDWRELGLAPDNIQIGGGFIKVVGSASSKEAGECMNAIAKFRSKSSCFVITNGVRIEGVADNESLPENFEAAKAFDVMAFINSNLDAEQQAAVKKLSEVSK